MTELPAWALLYPVVNLPQGQVRYMMQSLQGIDFSSLHRKNPRRGRPSDSDRFKKR